MENKDNNNFNPNPNENQNQSINPEFNQHSDKSIPNQNQNQNPQPPHHPKPQVNQQPNTPKPHKKMGLLQKVALISAVCGLLGGVIGYGGVSYLTSSAPSGSNSGGTVTRSNTTNVQNQSEQAFKSVRPAVVSVINMRKEANNPLAALFGGSSSSTKTSLQAASEGSGVIYKIHGNSAYLVTNNHVVAGSNKIKVILSNGKKVQAKVVGTNKSDDLAVVKINSHNVHRTATFGNSNHIQAGETSLAIGSPLGSTYASTLTQGIISNKSRKIAKVSNGQKAGTTNVIQTDAAINPGNSGGALINLDGQVIGINSAKVATDNQGTSVQGMGFAIPSNKVTHDINQIIAKNE